MRLDFQYGCLNQLSDKAMFQRMKVKKIDLVKIISF